MTLPLQILLVVILLVGLVTIIMSTKNWHWTQLVLVLFVFFSAIGYLYLAAKVMKVQHTLRAGIPRLEKDLADFNQRNERLLKGAEGEDGILELDHRLQIVTRERGRVWRRVNPTGQMDEQGRVSVEIANPQPHGLEQDTIVFAFEAGDPNAEDPAQGPQYLGEMRVVEVGPGGATLEPIHLLNQRSGERLSRSQGPWNLYETMPADRHKLFAGLTEEQLRQMLPVESVEEYLRHGTPATDDDDEWHRRGLDENDAVVGPEEIDKAVKFVYDRSLRDYAFLFGELAEQRVVKLASISAVREDNAKLEQALASAESLSEFRTQQQELLSTDLADMQQDREAIEAHLHLLEQQLSNARAYIDKWLAENSALARELTERQLGMLRRLNLTAPAPGGAGLTGAQ